MHDEEARELLALAAVDALDDDERERLDALAASRPELAAELAQLRQSAAVLADAMSEAPPPHLRHQVVSSIASEPQLPAVAPVVPLRSRRRQSWLTSLGAAAAAAVLAVVAIRITDDGESTDDRITAVVEADGTQTVELLGELDGLRLVHSPSHGDTALVGVGIPEPDDNDVYELWLIEDGSPSPVDTFRPHDGVVSLLIDGMTPPEGAAFAISIEPAGGSETPTGPIVAESTST